jgi:hypothetical protein
LGEVAPRIKILDPPLSSITYDVSTDSNDQSLLRGTSALIAQLYRRSENATDSRPYKILARRINDHLKPT